MPPRCAGGSSHWRLPPLDPNGGLQLPKDQLTDGRLTLQASCLSWWTCSTVVSDDAAAALWRRRGLVAGELDGWMRELVGHSRLRA